MKTIVGLRVWNRYVFFSCIDELLCSIMHGFGARIPWSIYLKRGILLCWRLCTIQQISHSNYWNMVCCANRTNKNDNSAGSVRVPSLSFVHENIISQTNHLVQKHTFLYTNSVSLWILCFQNNFLFSKLHRFPFAFYFRSETFHYVDLNPICGLSRRQYILKLNVVRKSWAELKHSFFYMIFRTRLFAMQIANKQKEIAFSDTQIEHL